MIRYLLTNNNITNQISYITITDFIIIVTLHRWYHNSISKLAFHKTPFIIFLFWDGLWLYPPTSGGPFTVNSVSEYELHAVVLADTRNLYFPESKTFFLKYTPISCSSRVVALLSSGLGVTDTRSETSLSYPYPIENKIPGIVPRKFCEITKHTKESRLV